MTWGADELPMDYIRGKGRGILPAWGTLYPYVRWSPGSPLQICFHTLPKTLLGQIGSIKYLIVALCVTGHAGRGWPYVIGLWRKRRDVVLSFSRYQG